MMHLSAGDRVDGPLSDTLGDISPGETCCVCCCKVVSSFQSDTSICC